ncbi:hypothetical protein niasHS_010850 [Heterodera schachtii]|uniref:Uncharacterized protein n=1 Tax=Heterodera schachtii TaxID=97005 RepID=A0ABD2J3D0_HETSC
MHGFSTTISKRFASNISEGHAEYYREFNRLASAGIWDQLNMRPKVFSTKTEKAAAMKVWQKMLPEDAGWFDRRPGGVFLKMLLHISLACFAVFMIPYTYEKVVPEEYRCKIKYKKNDGHH